MVVSRTICADCSLVFSGVFLGLFSVVCLERGVNPNDDNRFIMVSSNPYIVAGVRSLVYACNIVLYSDAPIIGSAIGIGPITA